MQFSVLTAITAYLHAGRGNKLHASPNHARAVVPLLLSPLGETYMYEGAATPAPLEQAVWFGGKRRGHKGVVGGLTRKAEGMCQGTRVD